MLFTTILDWLKPTVPKGTSGRELPLYPIDFLSPELVKPDVTLTPQPGPGEGLKGVIDESFVGGVPFPMQEVLMPGTGTWKETICKICSSELRYCDNPSLGPEYNIPANCPVCGDDLGVRSVRGEVQILESAQERITALGVQAEWFKENRGLVIVVIVALVLLFFFLKKRKR